MSERKQFVYVLKPVRLGMVSTGPTDGEMLVLKRHVAYLERLTQKGTVILFGRTQNADETTFGLVIFEDESAERAKQVMQSDPAVKEGLMIATIFPYRVAGIRRVEVDE